MDDKSGNWLEQSFFSAFPGIQKQIFNTLGWKYKLEFRRRSYRAVWDELLSTYGDDHLASIVIEETRGRLSESELEGIRKLFWSDETPLISTISSLDRNNWRAWVETVAGHVDGEFQEWVVQWSPFANLWFQYLDPEAIQHERAEPQARHGAFLVGIDEPKPLFAEWFKWRGAVVTEVVGIDADVLVAITKKTMYILKYWSGVNQPESPAPTSFVQSLLDTVELLRATQLAADRNIRSVACPITEFDPEATESAKENKVEVWGKEAVVANWMRAGAIGIAYDNGGWYVVGSPSARPRGHLTPKRRVRYS